MKIVVRYKVNNGRINGESRIGCCETKCTMNAANFTNIRIARCLKTRLLLISMPLHLS